MSSRHLFPEDYSNQREKCRACTDFKSWTKQQTFTQNEKSEDKVTSRKDITMVLNNSVVDCIRNDGACLFLSFIILLTDMVYLLRGKFNDLNIILA